MPQLFALPIRSLVDRIDIQAPRDYAHSDWWTMLPAVPCVVHAQSAEDVLGVYQAEQMVAIYQIRGNGALAGVTVDHRVLWTDPSSVAHVLGITGVIRIRGQSWRINAVERS